MTNEPGNFSSFFVSFDVLFTVCKKNAKRAENWGSFGVQFVSMFDLHSHLFENDRNYEKN